ncbi:MAG: hypothetical protein KA347_02215 [Bacteroidia bacterium]|nr:hypothetical protein [Bacteroidota bacterium]MBP6511464.1 hypothetical protein [Bacteroidia bacterium]MBP7244524.1 hypothetical protein [Bacteroidia bacterium]
MTNIPSPLRWTLILLFTLSLVYIGFKREKKLLIVEKGIPTFINRYPKKNVSVFEKTVMKGTFGIKVPAKMQSAVLYSLLFLIMGSSILFLYSKSLFIAKVIALLYLAYMVLSFLLLKLGDLGVDYRLSTGLSHYLEDLFLSPLIFLAVIAFIKAFGIQADEQKRT